MFKNKLNLRNMIVIIICLVTTIISGCNFEKANENQYKTVKLSLEGKKYDSLFLLANTIYRESPRIYGTTTDGYHWTFLVPDSIAEISSHFVIRNKNDNLKYEDGWIDLRHRIAFQTVVNGDVLRSSVFNFDKNENIIELNGVFETTTQFERTIMISEIMDFATEKTTTDYFTIDFSQNRFLRESMQMPAFFWFFDSNNPDKTHEEFLTRYANWVKENPNSLYLMTSLATSRSLRSEEDYEKLFNLFSPEMQNSTWGVIARRNFRPLNLEGIAAISLPNPLTKEYEKIILDPAKYTLLCISASWCAPCIRAIPRLREIHEATKGYLNLVYISVDDRTTIDSWNALMERENIAWRSLWLADMDLQSDWRIRGIPDYILVAPSGDARRIRLRTDEDIQELYSIVGL